MPDLLVRDLDAKLLARLKKRARGNHRSLQAEAKALLAESAKRLTRQEAVAVFDKWRRYWGDRKFSDSAELIREDRDSR